MYKATVTLVQWKLNFEEVGVGFIYIYMCVYIYIYIYIYSVIRNNCQGFNNCHLVLQMQPHVISFYGVTSRIGFTFLFFPMFPGTEGTNQNRQ